VKSIRRRLGAAGTIVALTGLAGVAYAAGNGSPAQPPAMVASAHGGQSAAISTHASGRKTKRRKAVAAASAATPSAPLKTRASGHGSHGRGEREGSDDAVGVDA
jgi:hypothetical protein